VEVTLIDRRNFHLFQPLTYQVATGALSPAEVCYPLRAIFKRRHNVRVLMAEVTDIDLGSRELRLKPSAGDSGPLTAGYDTLGPLLDVAEVVGGELAELVQAEAGPHDVTMALRRELGQRGPAIAVFDDAQWADEATLDVLRLLASRLEGVRARAATRSS
jgi:hypothetical protein